jgi:hypothetical protein
MDVPGIFVQSSVTALAVTNSPDASLGSARSSNDRLLQIESFNSRAIWTYSQLTRFLAVGSLQE